LTLVHRQRVVALLALAIVGAVLTGCSSSSPSNASSPSPAGSSVTSAASSVPAGGTKITISSFKFNPDSLTVAPGQTVTVLNNDSTAHTLTASAGKAFDTGTISPGNSGSFTAPTAPGSYPYTCTIHPFMHGTLIVK
jgi:plastocyanin